MLNNINLTPHKKVGGFFVLQNFNLLDKFIIYNIE